MRLTGKNKKVGQLSDWKHYIFWAAAIEHTPISVRRVLTEPKTALACAIDETFSARFVASIAALSSSMALSHHLGFWDLAFMVETRGGSERTVRREGCGEDF